MLTPEEQAQLDALNAKAKQTDAPKDLDIDKMSDADVRKLAVEAIDQKRSANEEAKKYRLKLEKKDREEADAKKKVDDENKTATEKLSAMELENERLKSDNLSINLKHQATTELLGKGFKPELVANAVQLTGLTEDNLNERITDFEKTFESYKGDKSKPDMLRRTTIKKTEEQKPDKITQSQRVFQEMVDAGDTG